MEVLSDELLVHVFLLVGWEEVGSKAVLVCRRWRDVGRDDALWRFFYRSHWPSPLPLGDEERSKAVWVERFRRRRDEVEWWRTLFVPTRGGDRVPTRISDLPGGLAPKSCEEFKVVVAGAARVGKSALVIQRIQDLFIEEYDPTIEDPYRKLITVDGKDVLINILDTAGQEEYSAMRGSYMRTGQVFLLVYSADSMESFRALGLFYDQINREKEAALTPMVMVENKIDLVDERQVPEGAGEMAAKALGCLFVSTSAKTREGVDDAFYGAVKLCLAVRAELQRAENKKNKKKGKRQGSTNNTGKKACLLS